MGIISSNSLLVEPLKLKQLLSTSKSGILASSVLAIGVAYVQSGIVAPPILGWWLFAVLLVAACRSIWIAKVQKTIFDQSPAQIHALLIRFRIGVLASGIVWGLAGYLLLITNNLQHEVFLIFMLAGLSTGGIVAYSADFVSAAAYTVAILLPVAIRLLLTDSPLSIWMGIAVLIYFGMVIVSLRSLHHKSLDNILLRLDASAKDSSIQAGEERYQLLLEHLPIGIFHFDINHVVTFCNRQLSEILQNSNNFNVGSSLDDLNDRRILSSLEETLNTGETRRYEGLYETSIGDSEQWIGLLCAPTTGPQGEVTGGIGIVQDITERKQSGKQIEKLALQDYLTELPNRRMLIDRLQHALDNNAATRRDVALLYIDLDNFKSLNDTLGHAVGDLLLQQVAKRLSRCLRQRDLMTKVARIGGDEFVVVLEDLSENSDKAAKQAEVVSNKIMSKLNETFKLAKHEYQCSASIGVSLYNAYGGSVDDLLRQADIAMYQAKEVGNIIRFYNSEMLAEINTREDMKRALRRAINGDEFQLHYQVQVDQLQMPTGVEALIRWNRPKHGMVPPMDFIPLAEETGLIIPIGNWVVNTACAQLREWEKDSTMQALTIAINVSITQLMEPDFAKEVKRSIKKYKVNPALLKIELTESMFLDNASEVINTMKILQKIGVKFELDDFGTGYSCLQYLKQLPLHQLKIDQSFVRDIDKDKSDQSIVKTIIAMAEGFNMDVIAEGVETESQYLLLNRYGCKHFQGYYFGKPMPIDEFELEFSKSGEMSVN